MMLLTTSMRILFLFAASCGVVCVSALSCKDMNGNDVDWYYVYKLPVLPQSTNPLMKKGVAFYYLDNFQQTFQISKTSIEEKSQPIAQTLQQIYNSKIANVMYNDQPPNGSEKITSGHTKGVVAYDDGDGFWLMHSIPWFPKNDSYEWPTGAMQYGQTAVCVSLKSSAMEAIAKQMLYTQPYVYSKNLTTDLLDIAPTFMDVVKRRFVKSPPWTHKGQLQSRDGQKFTHYAKSKQYHKDLYFDFVAQDLKCDLLAETWRRQTALSSNCSLPYHVYNIGAIQFPLSGQFKYTKDHSKWTITSDEGQIICVGDINRMSTQFKRGGGALCSHIPSVWQQYNNSVAQVELCPRNLQRYRGL